MSHSSELTLDPARLRELSTSAAMYTPPVVVRSMWTST
jgi:hypothetical protein